MWVQNLGTCAKAQSTFKLVTHPELELLHTPQQAHSQLLLHAAAQEGHQGMRAAGLLLLAALNV
jgi:hypothetical protein